MSNPNFFNPFNEGSSGGSGGDSYTRAESDAKFAQKKQMGNLNNLTTEDKTSIVAAINEINGAISYPILCNTTAKWNSQPSLIAQNNTCYVYLDYKIVNGVETPGIKIGDGTTHLINLPFVSASNGITDQERQNWNEKVKVSVNQERLIFSTD